MFWSYFPFMSMESRCTPVLARVAFFRCSWTYIRSIWYLHSFFVWLLILHRHLYCVSPFLKKRISANMRIWARFPPFLFILLSKCCTQFPSRIPYSSMYLCRQISPLPKRVIGSVNLCYVVLKFSWLYKPLSGLGAATSLLGCSTHATVTQAKIQHIFPRARKHNISQDQ